MSEFKIDNQTDLNGAAIYGDIMENGKRTVLALFNAKDGTNVLLTCQNGKLVIKCDGIETNAESLSIGTTFTK